MLASAWMSITYEQVLGSSWFSEVESISFINVNHIVTSLVSQICPTRGISNPAAVLNALDAPGSLDP